jgi:hypothetical protein
MTRGANVAADSPVFGTDQATGMSDFPQSQAPATDAVRLAFLRVRNNVLRLVTDREFPELQTWSGTAKLFGLWVLLLVGFAVTPVYVLLRLPFRRGGWRFALAVAGLVTASAFVGLLLLLAAGLSGMGVAH